MIDLSGKSILLFAPNFFGYDIEVKNKLLEYGANVDLYDERPSKNFLIKVIIRLDKRFIQKYANKYFERIILSNKDSNYDYIFIIKGEVFTPHIVRNLKVAFPAAKLILYLWDSIHNYKDIRNSLNLFDRKLTFDYDDSIAVDSLIFRPLFYLDDFVNCKDSATSNFKYDLLFVGTVHSDRWQFLEEVKKQAIKNNLNYCYYLYIQSPLIFIVRKIFDRKFRTIPLKDVRFRPIHKSKIIKLILVSSTILDIQHPKQTGLTIRTLEALGAGRKLITTNSSIKKYDLYSSQNIMILDRLRPSISTSFFKNNYDRISEVTYRKYSIGGWIEDVFDL